MVCDQAGEQEEAGGEEVRARRESTQEQTYARGESNDHGPGDQGAVRGGSEGGRRKQSEAKEAGRTENLTRYRPAIGTGGMAYGYAMRYDG